MEHFTSEYLFASAALAVNKVISRDGKLDIEVMGLVHALAFMGAFVRLLFVTRNLRARALIWIAALVILTDVGYVAYWNSFYTEPATCIFFLLVAAESTGMLGGISRWRIARWCLWAAMLVWAKSSNYPLAVVLVPLAIYLGWRGKQTRIAGIAGACVIAGFAILTMWTRPVPMQQATTYNSIFMAILPESHTADSDLQALGLDPRLVSYSGTGAWTPRTAFGELYNGVLLRDVTGATVARFYLTHPARIWRRARVLLPVAFSLRPEWCGNFEASAGRPEGVKTRSFTLWSSIHERVLAPVGRYILIALAILPAVAFRRGLQYKFLGALAAGAVIAFLTAACGDAWDNVKHMYLFNMLLDATLISTLALLARRIART